jgi:hypothetical protein
MGSIPLYLSFLSITDQFTVLNSSNIWSMEKSNIINLLDKEIDLILISEKRSGINFWIIIAGLASLIWLFLLTLDSLSYLNQKILILYFILSLLLNFLYILYRLTQPKKEEGMKRGTFLESRKRDPATHIIYLLYLSAQVTLGFLYIPNLIIKIFFIIIYSFHIIVYIINYILPLSTLPIVRISRNNKKAFYIFRRR